MICLAIDTSGESLSVALDDGERTHLIEIDAGLRHSERLMEAVDALFSLSRTERAAISMVACMKGPGSFTGLRIGMSAAKGIAAALGVPLYAVPTLECSAASRAAWPGIALPLIDAKKSRWYAAPFRGGERAGPDRDADAAEIAAALRAAGAADVLVCGPDAPRAAAVLAGAAPELRFAVDARHRSGAALELAAIARRRAAAGDPGDGDGAGIDYLRKSEAEITKEAKNGAR